MDEYMVVLPEAHPLCVKEKIEIENLENEPSCCQSTVEKRRSPAEIIF